MYTFFGPLCVLYVNCSDIMFSHQYIIHVVQQHRDIIAMRWLTKKKTKVINFVWFVMMHSASRSLLDNQKPEEHALANLAHQPSHTRSENVHSIKHCHTVSRLQGLRSLVFMTSYLTCPFPSLSWACESLSGRPGDGKADGCAMALHLSDCSRWWEALVWELEDLLMCQSTSVQTRWGSQEMEK